MKCEAIILAAGRGERMRPLTDVCPKPLLQVRGKPMMQWPIEALANSGVRSIIVNVAWLGQQITAQFGARFSAPADGASARPASPVELHYSDEGRDFGGALETAGGIVRVLPQLADPFWVVAGDVFAPEFPFSPRAMRDFGSRGTLAHLWLVPNPQHNPHGDFALAGDGMVHNDGARRHTYSTIGLYRHALFAAPYCSIAAGNAQGIKAALAPILRAAINDARISAQLYTGPWVDVGTPERLAQLNQPIGC